jgi:hypothetical protein
MIMNGGIYLLSPMHATCPAYQILLNVIALTTENKRNNLTSRPSGLHSCFGSDGPGFKPQPGDWQS